MITWSLFHDCSRWFSSPGSQDGHVKVWDIIDGTLLLTVPDAGDEISTVKCCCDDQMIVVSSKSGISVISFETGEMLHRLVLWRCR